jgi:hypothetical protein
VEVGVTTVEVKMGWGFTASIPLISIQSVAAYAGSTTIGSIGVHGWRGRWLVNGSLRGLVQVDIDPGAKASVAGFPVRLRQLLVSLDQPEAFMASIRSASPGLNA